jgi:hypothetical protein
MLRGNLRALLSLLLLSVQVRCEHVLIEVIVACMKSTSR